MKGISLKKGDWVRVLIWDKYIHVIETIDTVILNAEAVDGVCTVAWTHGWGHTLCPIGVGAWNVTTCLLVVLTNRDGVILKKLCPQTIPQNLKKKFKPILDKLK